MLIYMSSQSSRLKALMDSYKSLRKSGAIDDNMTIIASMMVLVKSPAPSFFLAEESVRNYLFRYERNDMLKGELARTMQKDLYRAYEEQKELHPYYTRDALVSIVAKLPAPRYYISHKTAAIMLFWNKKKISHYNIPKI